MNTYNDNLQSTVGTTLAALAAEKNRLKSMRLAQAYSLYYAQGAEITAREALDETRDTAASCQATNAQSLLNQITAVNLLQSASGANTDVGASIANMATAASNANIAANAIGALAADLGAALNNTFAAMYGTDLYHQTVRANSLINEVANDAKYLSRLAMDASSSASEIVASAMLSQVSVVKGKIDALTQTTQAEYDKCAGQANADKSVLGKAIQLERQSEGALLDTLNQQNATDSVYRNASRVLNLDLQVQVRDLATIEVAFQPLLAPPSFVTVVDGHVAGADPAYYLALLPQDQVAAFSVEQAEQLFASNPELFYTVHPHAGTDGDGGTAPQTVTLAKDANGEQIETGQPYVAYLYLVLSPQYQRYIGNFLGLLTSPSLPFVPAVALPLAKQAPAPRSGVEKGLPLDLYFTVAPTPHPVGMELRYILVALPQDGFQHYPSSAFPHGPVYFDVDVALQVAPGNYERGNAIDSAPAPEKKIGKGEPAPATGASANDATSDEPARGDAAATRYVVHLTATSTDNFGGKLQPGVRYQPYVLTTVDNEANLHATRYLSVLSDGFTPISIPSNS